LLPYRFPGCKGEGAKAGFERLDGAERLMHILALQPLEHFALDPDAGMALLYPGKLALGNGTANDFLNGTYRSKLTFNSPITSPGHLPGGIPRSIASFPHAVGRRTLAVSRAR